MDRWIRNTFRAILTLLWLLVLITPVKADFDLAYCTSQNTASSGPANDDYQSNGWCTDKCKGSAFAVIQYKSCWCTDYAPGDDLHDVSECGDICPGYGTEKCGNKSKNLKIYLRLDAQPSGTQGAPKSTSTSRVSSNPDAALPAPASETSTPRPAPPSSTSAVQTSQEPETVVQTVTGVPETVTLISTPTPKPEPTSTRAPVPAPATLQTSTTPTPVLPQTSFLVVTQSGVTLTQTVVSTPTATPDEALSQKSGSNTAAIAGGVVGGVVGLAAIAGAIVFLLFRRRRQQQQDDENGQNGVHRNVSTMSRSGLLRGRGEKHPQLMTTDFARRQSGNLDQDATSPVSASDRRNSRHMVDQRLNPTTLFVLDNSSRDSVGTMDDSRDYHRALNVRNPDP